MPLSRLSGCSREGEIVLREALYAVEVAERKCTELLTE